VGIGERLTGVGIGWGAWGHRVRGDWNFKIFLADKNTMQVDGQVEVQVGMQVARTSPSDPWVPERGTHSSAT
jgi:hypothetical protein